MFPVFTTPAPVAACSLITMDNVCVKQAVNGAQHRNNDLAIVELNFIIITWVQTSIVYCLGLTMTDPLLPARYSFYWVTWKKTKYHVP